MQTQTIGSPFNYVLYFQKSVSGSEDMVYRTQGNWEGFTYGIGREEIAAHTRYLNRFLAWAKSDTETQQESVGVHDTDGDVSGHHREFIYWLDEKNTPYLVINATGTCWNYSCDAGIYSVQDVENTLVEIEIFTNEKL